MRKIFKAPETVEPRGDKYERSVAIHEAGHALISELLDPGSVNLVSINRHSGGIGGITSYYQDDNYWLDIQYMENRVMSLLGGKAATEIKLGVTDIGANADIHRAYAIVERFIDHYCSYGFDKFQSEFSSEKLLEKKENFIYMEIERYYKQVKRMIAENVELLDKITDALMVNKTITACDIKELKCA
jgi:cell division protease FtsH